MSFLVVKSLLDVDREQVAEVDYKWYLRPLDLAAKCSEIPDCILLELISKTRGRPADVLYDVVMDLHV